MSHSRHRRRVRETEALPDWPLELGFWLPLLGLAGYLGWVHRAHAWGVLQWVLLAGAVVAIIARLLRGRGAARRADPAPPHGSRRDRN